MSVSVHFAHRGYPTLEEVEWVHHFRSDAGSVTISIGRFVGTLLLYFPRIAAFSVSEDLSSVVIFSEEAASETTLRHLLLDQVLPRIVGQFCYNVFHASAVEVSGRAIAFIGPSGSGKSTLAAQLQNMGHPVLSDDCVQLRRKASSITVLPAYPGIRLWPDAVRATRNQELVTGLVAGYGEKHRIGADQVNHYSGKAFPLSDLFVLSRIEGGHALSGPRVASINAGQLFIELVKNSFVLDITDKRFREKQFEEIAGIFAGGCVCHKLNLEHDFNRLSEIADEVLSVVR